MMKIGGILTDVYVIEFKVCINCDLGRNVRKFTSIKNC